MYRCVQAGTVSLATAPEPGSRCVANEIDDNAAAVPNLWGAMGVFSGTLYERQQDGKTVYGTRKLPGAVKVLGFTVKTPPDEPAHVGLGSVGKPRLDRHAAQFRAAARRPASTMRGCARSRMPKAVSTRRRCRPKVRRA